VIFLSSTPINISLLDWAFLGRALTSLRSWVSLFFILIGATGYVMTEQKSEGIFLGVGVVRRFHLRPGLYQVCL